MDLAVQNELVQEIVNACFVRYPAKQALYNWEEYFLMNNHPLMCGLILQAGLVNGHWFVTRIASDEGLVRPAMHLTHAVTLAGFLPIGHAWADLEYIIKKYGDAHLFVGERLKKLSECYRRMNLAFSFSASHISVGKRK
jgi:hypothetical protein